MSVEKLLTFEDTHNVKVRTWNRCAMWMRACGQGGLDAGTLYLRGVDMEGRQQVVAMLKDIQARGYTAVRREVTATI